MDKTCFSLSWLETRESSRPKDEKESRAALTCCAARVFFDQGWEQEALFSSCAEDFHGALEQLFKIALFDSWARLRNRLALHRNHGYLFVCLKIRLSLIHRDTSCKRLAELGVVTGTVKSFHLAGGPGIRAMGCRAPTRMPALQGAGREAVRSQHRAGTAPSSKAS